MLWAFFDSLKKIFDTVDDLTKSSEQNVSDPTKAANTANDNILATENVPAKPSVKRETIFFGGEEGDDEFSVSFMLSGDFIEFNSHCELDPAFQYEPDNNEDYTEYKENLPQIFIGPVNSVYDAAEQFEANGAPVGDNFESIGNGTFLFKSTFDYHGDAMYAYAFASGTTQKYNALALTYNRKFIGTPLERKLKAALDEAAATYSEIKQ